MMSAATPKKHAMPIMMIERGFSMAWESVVVRPGAGRLETRADSNAEGRGPAGIVVACDIALVLLMRGRHNRHRVGLKLRKPRPRLDFGIAVAHYSRNGRAHSADTNWPAL